ncbi:MAG TPA: hypothetical protein VIN11_08080 [Roseivirga sp.]
MNNTAFKILKYAAIVLASLALIWFGYAWIVGDELTLPWQVESTFKTRPFLIEYFQLNGKPFGVVADQIISWQKFRTGELEFLLWPHYTLLIGILFTLIFGTLAITYLDRFSYFIFAGLFIFGFIQLRLEELGVADPYLTYGLIIGFLGLSYYFQAIKKSVSILIRTMAIIAFYGLFILLINFLPNMDYPNLVTLSFGLIGPLLWVTLFIVFIAGDNIYSLFKLTTQGELKGKNGLIHFGVIGLIYIGLIVLLFLQKNEVTSFTLYLVEPQTILIFSMVSGYFCFDRKIETMAVGGDTFVLKHWLYPILCALTLLLLAYCKIMAIDSLENALEWVIVISHLAFGAAFFIYALINFIPDLLQNIPVWQSFFQGSRTPMLTVRLFSIIMVVGGFLYLENRPYYQAKSGQYTILASLAEYIGNDLLSDQYHKQANFLEFYNFRSNYALAQRAKTIQERADVPQRYAAILRGSENPKARVAFSNQYAEKDQVYRSLSALMNSKEKAYNEQVQNNLGSAHYEYQNYDSAFAYFNQSLGGGAFVSEGNLAALNYDIAANVDFDTTLNYEYENNIHLKLNRQALANAHGQFLPFSIELREDTLLTREQLFYLYNAALSLERSDFKAVESAIDFYQSSPKNDQYNTFLLTAKSFLYYNSGQVNKAFRTLEYVISSNLAAAGFPYYVKAIWAFDQGQPELTVESINNASKRGYRESPLNAFMEELKTLDKYEEKANLESKLQSVLSAKQSLSQEEYKNRLYEIATLNAFDVETTLKAISLLKIEGINSIEEYQLVLEALEVNQKSTVLMEAYIYLCAENGYSSFGETALDNLSELVSTKKLDEVVEKFEEILEERRKSRAVQ